MEGLTVGRMVHYVAYGTPGGEYEAGAHRAAIVAEVKMILDRVEDEVKHFTADERCTLMVINPTGIHFHPDTPFDDHEKKPGTWHWIERA